MGVNWTVEEGYLRIESGDGVVAWTFKNGGDEPASPGSQKYTATVWSKEMSPWVQELEFPSGDDEVAPGHTVPMSFKPTWDGQEHGTYSVRIDFNDGTATSETYFDVDERGNIHPPRNW